MGADSRATAGNIIADKQCEKVHKLTESIYACGAGTAADLDQVTKMLSANLRLIELNTGKKAQVITAVRQAKQHLYRYMGYIGAYLLIGGVDSTGPHIYDVSAEGTTMAKSYAADGSGSYAAISVLERDFKFGMTVSFPLVIYFYTIIFSGRRSQGSCPTCPSCWYARRQRLR